MLGQNKIVKVVDVSENGSHLARTVASELTCDLIHTHSDGEYILEFSDSGVRLLDRRGKKTVEVIVDFMSGASAHRIKFGGGKGQSIAKAIGVSSRLKPSVLDATAGLGKDAFVLAGLGCEVLMLERSPIAYALLADGLQRARNTIETVDEQLVEAISRMSLEKGDAREYLATTSDHAVNTVYLDPMFPDRKKSAQVKKDMMAFQHLIGHDDDADTLLESAIQFAKNRVVVKRPVNAPFLAGRQPGYQIKGKSTRFDIYPKMKLE